MYAQKQPENDNFFYSIELGRFDESQEIIKGLKDRQLQKQLYIYLSIFKSGDAILDDKNLPSSNSKSSYIEALSLINRALKIYLKQGQELKAYEHLKSALAIAEKKHLKDLIKVSCKLILDIYSRSIFSKNDISYKYILAIYRESSSTSFDYKLSAYYDFKITMRYFYADSVDVIKSKYKKVNRLFKNDTTSFIKAQLSVSNASFHNRLIQNMDSCYFYLSKANEYFKNTGSYIETEKQNALDINLAALEFQRNKPNESLEILNNLSNKYDGYVFDILDSYSLYYKYLNYLKLGDSTKALKHQNEYLTKQLLQNQSKNLQLLSEYETKYETERKERENIKLSVQIATEKRQKRNAWIISLVTVLFSFLLGYFITKNTKRKQKLAEQERALQSQKLATVLKEQELTAIDAMIEGQEKERQRIANDLHDDLGGLMATVKLHFNALKNKGSAQLYDKTSALIEEAYQKVRSVAHAKNSGVIAKQGLLKAIKHMAEKISVSNKIEINVLDYGLNQRLENSLELTLFRIIQELITNIIKHSEATEATIHLTNHENTINIMVEDNGKGFNPNQITKTNKGMGISSIDKRVEYLEGKLTIESEINKGTTVIIDIPL